MLSPQKPRLLVLGTGFAAFSLLKSLNRSAFDTTVISPRNHFLFTPLLPSTTVGTLEFRSIIEPIRRGVPGIRYYQARCTNVDTIHKEIFCNSIIDCFERASQPTISEDRRKHLLHFVIVGGGPTGVEFAAEMHDFIREDLRKPYSPLIPYVKITILEAGPSILNTFDVVLSNYTARFFRRQQIEVRTNSPVIRVEADAIVLKNGETVPFGLLVWSTGIGPTKLIQSLPLPKSASLRLLTDAWFRVRGTDGIYALGDCTAFESMEFPATSQVAQQEGRYLAKVLEYSRLGRSIAPFRYHHYGMLAYVGSNRALADLATVKGRGLTTWIFWRSAYLTKLVSLKNKTLVVFDWIKTFVFGRDISRF
jgi:NADH:ubiquinone reductase (non-electrogenic)